MPNAKIKFTTPRHQPYLRPACVKKYLPNYFKMDLINEILNKCEITASEAKKSVQVNKLIPPEVFPNDLLVCDTNELNTPKLRGPDKEDELQNIARDCIQILMNKVVEFPKETKDGKSFIQVSGPAFHLPREKRLPVPKPLTKWQKFAKEKGLKKTKKPKSTWDDVLQKWVPTYGYRKAAAEKEKNWLIEVPQNVDPNTDMFAEKAKTKKENVDKNEYQRLRNIAAARKIKVPKVGVPPMEGNLHVPQLQFAADVARVSTASLGRFQPRLPEDKQKAPLKNSNKKKRKLLSVNEEKEMQLSIADTIAKKKPKLNIAKAIGKQLQEEQTDRQRANKSESKPKSRKSKNRKGGQKKRKGEPKNHRVSKKNQHGRKRR